MPEGGELAWFFGFWGGLVLLCGAEAWAGGEAGTVRRRLRWPVNLGLGLVNGLLASLVPVTAVVIAAWAASQDFGLLNRLDAGTPIMIVGTLVFRSLAQWVFHRLCHAVPWLWAVHRVHHSDAHLDATSGLRFHPLEFVAGLFWYLPLAALCGLHAPTLAAFELMEVAATMLTHTSLRLPDGWEKRLRLVFITPGLHRLHHSARPAETDTNFGAVVSVWDRLFGTLIDRPKTGGDFTLGLRDVGLDERERLARMLTLPFRGRSGGTR